MDMKANGILDEKDLLINILRAQRTAMLDQITALQWEVEKMKPFMPKEPVDDDKRIE